MSPRADRTLALRRLQREIEGLPSATDDALKENLQAWVKQIEDRHLEMLQRVSKNYAARWKLYQEIPHLFEVIITVTIFCIYIVVYRFILYRLPILFAWKEQPEEALAAETARPAPIRTTPSPAGAMYRKID